MKTWFFPGDTTFPRVISSGSFLRSQTPVPQGWMLVKCSPFFLLPFLDCYFPPVSCENVGLFETLAVWLYFPLLLMTDYLLPASQPFHLMYWTVEHVVHRFLLFKPQVLMSVFTLFSIQFHRTKSRLSVENFFSYLHWCPSSVFPLSVGWDPLTV